MLLVLGMSFLMGGYKHHEQKFNKLGSSMWTSMLLVACLLLIILTVFANVDTINSTGEPTYALDRHQIKDISRMCAVLMVMSYVASLVFTLGTHAATMDDESGDQEELRMQRIETQIVLVPEGQEVLNPEQIEEEQEEERKKINLGCAVLLLLISTTV